MKISIITAVLNGRDTIEQVILALSNQTYRDIEHLVIDGGSTDGTLEILEKHKKRISRIVSEPDRGIYDAFNKGLRLVSGDIVGFLHGDDFYAHDQVLEKVADVFQGRSVDSCYGDLQYVDRDDAEKVIRHWKASEYCDGKFRRGWMPPHPTFFVRRKVYEQFGLFNEDFRIAGDYELMLRFFEKHRITTYYIPEVLVKMRSGGTSNRSLKNLFIKSSEDYRAWKVNHLHGGLHTILLKNVSKIPQFFAMTRLSGTTAS